MTGGRVHGFVILADTLIYILTCFFVFIADFIFGINKFSADTVWYLAIGFVIFPVMRFILSCYKCTFRYESIDAFARELVASVLGGTLFSMGAYFIQVFFDNIAIHTSLVVVFSTVYAIISLGVRMFYAIVYYFSIRKDPPRSLSFVIRALRYMGAIEEPPKEEITEEDAVSHSPINELQRLIHKFAVHGEVTKVTQINKGYINRTYKIETLSEHGHVHKYTFQRINTNVFPPVDELMENFRLTTNHLRERNMLLGQRAQGPVQTLRLTKDGKSFLRDDTGCWRMLTYFDDVYSLDIPDDKETFYHAGLAFGAFLREMSDVDVSKIYTVIPNFHNTRKRYLDLEEAIERDAKGRAKDVMPEIEFIRSIKDTFGVITDALEAGRIPTRVCHNDCNLNNILFDTRTHLPVAIIDLDTVMPSSPLYDYGDSMRIGTNKAKDDEKDLSKVWCDLSLYERYARGYLEACGDILTEEELNLLPYAAEIITVEDGIRFLADHIDGDVYYNIYYPGQNLDRARTQLRLVLDMQNKRDDIVSILKKIYKELGLKSSL